MTNTDAVWIVFLLLASWIIVFVYLKAGCGVDFNNYCLGTATVLLVVLGLFLMFEATFLRYPLFLKYPLNSFAMFVGLIALMFGFYPASKIRIRNW